MSIFTANLKHFYQWRGVWFWYVIILCQTPMIILPILSKTKNYDRLLGHLIVSFLTGILAAGLQKNVLSKPFSFCLPGYRHIVRPFIFRIGVIVNLLLGCVFFGYPGFDFPYVLLVVLAGGFFGMVVYFYGVYGGFVKIPAASVGILGLIIPLTILFKWDMILQNIIIHHPIVIIIVSTLVCIWVWRLLDRDILARKYCGKLVMGVLDSWNQKKISKYKMAQLAEKEQKKPNSTPKISSGVESFFISRINRAETNSLPRYIWGSFYRSFGIAISQQRQNLLWILIIILPILCFFCYIPGEGVNIIFIIPGIMVLYMSLWVYSSLLTAGGRKQRFWSALTLAVVTGIFICVALVLLTLATHLLEGIMPPLIVKGHEFTFNALNINFAHVPFLITPVSLTIGLIFPNKPMLRIICVIVLFQISFLGIFLHHQGFPVQIGPLHVIILLFCTWTLFISVLHRISYRRCLVKHTK